MNLLINCNQLILIFNLLFVIGLKFVMHFWNLVEAINDYLCGDPITGHRPVMMSLNVSSTVSLIEP
jgi:hypothetical protein